MQRNTFKWTVVIRPFEVGWGKGTQLPGASDLTSRRDTRLSKVNLHLGAATWCSAALCSVNTGGLQEVGTEHRDLCYLRSKHNSKWLVCRISSPVGFEWHLRFHGGSVLILFSMTASPTVPVPLYHACSKNRSQQSSGRKFSSKQTAVSWCRAVMFLRKLSVQNKRGPRLPSYPREENVSLPWWRLHGGETP